MPDPPTDGYRITILRERLGWRASIEERWPSLLFGWAGALDHGEVYAFTRRGVERRARRRVARLERSARLRAEREIIDVGRDQPPRDQREEND